MINTFDFQATNKNLVAQTEELVKDRTNQADVFAQKLEEKLTQFNGAKSTDVGSLGSFKTELTELLQKNSVGLTEADRAFLRELSNDTRDAIQDMRLEVLTASDKS